MPDQFITNEFGQVRSGDVAHSTVAVPISSTSVVTANPLRLWLRLQNAGGGEIFVSIDEGDAVLDGGILLSPGESIEFSASQNGIYRGEVFAIAPVAPQDLLISESPA